MTLRTGAHRHVPVLSPLPEASAEVASQSDDPFIR